MDKESETQAIEEWLRTVDKPLANKEEDKNDRKTERKNQTQNCKQP
jgi:hypothetical protein